MAVPKVIISNITAISSTSTLVDCVVTNTSPDPIIKKGVVYSIAIPTTENEINSGSGNGNYTSNIFNTTANTVYWVRAYVDTQYARWYSVAERFVENMGSVRLIARGSGNVVINEDENYGIWFLNAGGGGGGDANGSIYFSHAGAGGGGAGAYQYGTRILDGDFPVTVGAGGARNTGNISAAHGGSSTVFGITTLQGGGGGAVAGGIAGYPYQKGDDGASGGGGGSYQTISGTLGGAGVAGQGNNGGNGDINTYVGGGGGSKASAGGRPTAGAGIVNYWVDGTARTYSEGGTGGINIDQGGIAANGNGSGGGGARDSTEITRAGAAGGGGIFLMIVGYNLLYPPIYSYTLTPTSHDFGTIILDSAEQTQIVNIENTGNKNLTINITDSTNFYSNVSTLQVLVGNTEQVTIFAKTNIAGIHNETIIFSEPNNIDKDFNVQSEIREIIYSYTVTPQNYDFGEIPLGFPYGTKDFLIENTGDLPLTLNIALNGNYFYFSISDTQITVNPNQIVPLTVKAYTDIVGLRTGFFKVEDANLQAPTSYSYLSKYITIIPVSGLIAHYEEFVNNGHTMYYLSDQTNIEQWDDLSGNNNHANWTQVTGYDSPNFVTNATVQGIWSFYTGGAFNLFNDVNIPLQTGDRTVFYVGTRTLHDVGSYLYNTNPAINGVLQSNNIGNNFSYTDNINGVSESYNVSVGLEKNIVVSALKGGTSLLLKHNGDIKFSGATNSSSNSIINILGGDDSGASGYFQYYMNVFIFYDRLLSDEEIIEVEDYLGEKYDVFIGNFFTLQTNPINFPQVELGVIGIDQPNALISTHNDLLDITFANTPNFTISGITSPHTLPASYTSTFNVQHSIPYTTLGLKSEQIAFIPNTGNNKTLIINIEVILFAPTNLNGQSYFSKSYLSWLDGSVEANIDGFIIERDSGTGFIEIGTSTTTNFIDDNVIAGQNYNYRVKAFVSSGDSPYSNIFNITISDEILPEFCILETPYTVTDETGCNTNDGVIEITDYLIYNLFYNFELKNTQGQVFNHDSNGVYSNLSANYYSLTAIPISSTFTETCTFNWIIVNNNSPYFITGETIQNAVCGSFNVQYGFAIIETNMTDGYNYWFYNQNGSLKETDNNIGSLTLKNLQSGDYNLFIENIADGCSIFYTFNISEGNKLYSVPNIQEIYISKWDENLDWNYWGSGNLLNSSAQSLKINEYLNYNQWYSIIVDEQNVNFTSALSKARQGLTFNDVLTIGIPFNDTDKWNTLKQVLKDKWVVVFRDANDNYWTFGFKHGAQAEDYTFGSELAGFTLAFSGISDDKIITAIDETFVINNIK